MAACLFTNPFDVAKVRMQLQGELLRARGGGPKVYRNIIDCLRKTVAVEGPRPATNTAYRPAASTHTHTCARTRAHASVRTHPCAGLGSRGAQRGLSVALLREGSRNVFRIGMYGPIMRLLHDKREGPIPFWKRLRHLGIP